MKWPWTKAKELELELNTIRTERDELARKIIEIENQKLPITPGASSSRDLPQSSYEFFETQAKVVQPEFEFDCIPIIRMLVKINPDLSQAYNDTVRLANTGHKIFFDQSVSPTQLDEMREFLLKSSKSWHAGAAGINGIVNKMFRQMLVGGALSTEWVPNFTLDNLDEVRFILPERIRVILDRNYKGYQFYQKLYHTPIQNPTKELRRLNPTQYKYFALNGDTDVPYGIPPYLAALDAIKTQRNMIDNIKYIVETLGVLGWVDAKITKPNQQQGESDAAYIARGTQLLNEFKSRIQKGMRDGVTVGFTDEHEFDFKQTAKTAQGAAELFELNELLIASAIGYDAAFMGRPGASETLVTILFTKMIAQLTNYQDIVKENLEYGYKLALQLGGYKFKNLRVQFNRSTITDDLKYQQAEEIKLRNVTVKYAYGYIGQEQAADEMGYIKPDQKEPRIDINNVDPQTGEVKRQKREADKDKSARKSRDKSKPQGTRRTKPAKNS